MAVDSKSSNRSVSRALKILQAINRHGSLSMMQIAKMVELPYPTTCRLVNTLVSEGVIERETLRKYYRPTALSQSLSCGYHTHSRMTTIARQHIQELTCKTGWPVAISSRVGAYMVIQESTHALTTQTFSEYTPGYSEPNQTPLVYSSRRSSRAEFRRKRRLGPISFLLAHRAGYTSE